MDGTNQCIRSMSSLAADCMTNSALDASSYFTGFKVIPVNFQSVIYEIMINFMKSFINIDGFHWILLFFRIQKSSRIFLQTAQTPPISWLQLPHVCEIPLDGPVPWYFPLSTSLSSSTVLTPAEIQNLYNSSLLLEIIPEGNHTCIDIYGMSYTCNFDVMPSPSYELDGSTGEYYCYNTTVKVLLILLRFPS